MIWSFTIGAEQSNFIKLLREVERTGKLLGISKEQ